MKFSKLALIAASTLIAAGCSSHHSTLAAHPLASIPGYDKAAAVQILTADGIPVHGTSAQQLAFGRTLLTKTARQQLAVKLAIPKANRKPFEADLLTDAKSDHVLTSKAGRVKLLEQDLPGLLEKYQAHSALPSSSPSV
jgi:hypothetical protein